MRIYFPIILAWILWIIFAYKYFKRLKQITMPDQTLSLLGSASNVQFAFAPTDADGKPTKFDPSSPVTYTATAGSVDDKGLWTIPVDFNAESAPISATANYKGQIFTVDVTGLDAEVANLNGSATVVPK